jgi:hypothetical protein
MEYRIVEKMDDFSEKIRFYPEYRPGCFSGWKPVVTPTVTCLSIEYSIKEWNLFYDALFAIEYHKERVREEEEDSQRRMSATKVHLIQ